MRRVFTLIVALLTATVLYAQEPYTVYCTITGECAAHNPRATIGTVAIDYGQQDLRNNDLADSSGRRLKFQSMVGAANYLATYGWELHDSYTSFSPSILESRMHDKIVTVWILKKSITSPEEITEGIFTR